MKLYAYCLTERIDALPEGLNGIGGAGVHLFTAGDFSLLVSDFNGDAVPVTRDNALAHAAVVRSVLNETTPLPFRFGTLVSEPQLENYVTTRREALQSKLELVRDCVEMSVKIIWDRDWTEEPPAASPEKPGTAFLFEKRRQLLGSEVRSAEANRIASWLQDKVVDTVRETRVETNPTEKLLLAASHLLKRALVRSYRHRLAEARTDRPELHFLVSGPWPPYSFANIDLEFKTQFGVS
jgi:hypothetical protein